MQPALMSCRLDVFTKVPSDACPDVHSTILVLEGYAHAACVV